MIQAATPEDILVFSKLVSYKPTSGFRGIKLVKDNVIRAMVGYDRWAPNSVQMHIYISDKFAMNHQFVREAFTYPFVTCDKGVAIGVTPADNLDALKFNENIGFVETYRMKDGWDVGVDVVVQEMRRENCRWIKRTH